MMKKSIIKKIIFFIVLIFILFNLRGGGTYQVGKYWGTFQLILIKLIITAFIVWFFLKDYYFSKPEQKRLIIISIITSLFYFLPTILPYNATADYIIDDVEAGITKGDIDILAEKYPNAVLMVVPKDLNDNFIDILKYAKTKGFQIGVHGTLHYFPEGLIPTVVQIGYNKLNEKIEVDAYRNPYYLNNLIDFLYFKNKGVAHYPIGYGKVVIHY